MDATDNAQVDSMRTTLRDLMTQCDTLLGQLGDEGSRRYQTTMRALDRQLSQARDELSDLQDSALRRARATIRRADEYVHENPWQAGAGAAVTGILVGAAIVFLLTRK
jgi:ElaB/YqjD/DUF883 family membrane-anchored ribosome-binding protein